jgi:predicted outer membrane repeat protein
MVYVNGGIFKMNDGSSITSNNRSGVYVNSGTFEMNGGTISANKDNHGGGVYVNSWGSFIMNGGTISGNTANHGGGVYQNGANGTYIMSGGTISGNTANQGGGLYIPSRRWFTMSGGTITGNTATEYGGGVYATYTPFVKGTFEKTGNSTITGYDSAPLNGNVVKDSAGVIARRGHAVYHYSTRRKETTSGPGDNLSSDSDSGWDE